VFSDRLAFQIAQELPETATTTNPVDMAGGEWDLNAYERVIRHVMDSAEVDAVLFSGFFGGFGRDSEDHHELEMDVAGRLAQRCLESQVPLFVHSMNYDSEPAKRLRDHQIPVFWSADGAVRSLSMAVQWWDPVHDLPQLPEPDTPLTCESYWAARQLMIDAGVPFPRACLTTTLEQVPDAAGGLVYPLVVKALGLLHKTESDGVVLNISNEAELIEAATDLFARLSPPAVSIEEMAPVDDGVELIIGAKWDPNFGPVILIGIGGIYAEVLRDFATALAPIDTDTAEQLIRSLRMAPLLNGVRGKAPMNVASAAEIAARFSSLAAAHPEIREMEMNPVLVTPDGAIALDSRVLLRSRPTVTQVNS
jgi:acetate---CoA ligase (ADP-forming)